MGTKGATLEGDTFYPKLMGYGADKIPFASFRGHSETNAFGIFQGKGKEATERECGDRRDYFHHFKRCECFMSKLLSG